MKITEEELAEMRAIEQERMAHALPSGTGASSQAMFRAQFDHEPKIMVSA